MTEGKMKEVLMRLAALCALIAVSDMLMPDGPSKQTVRFVGGLTTACVILDLMNAARLAIGL